MTPEERRTARDLLVRAHCHELRARGEELIATAIECLFIDRARLERESSSPASARQRRPPRPPTSAGARRSGLRWCGGSARCGHRRTIR